jgi:uncharacterized protein (DUF2062 family)
MSRLRGFLEVLFHLEDTPHRIALAFAIGVWIAFFPLLGSHTLIALGVGFLFRLSRAALLIGAYVTNPWTLAPLFFAGTAVGCWLLGVPLDHIQQVYQAFVAREGVGLTALEVFLWPFIVGNLFVGTVLGTAAYFVVRPILERRAARRAV